MEVLTVARLMTADVQRLRPQDSVLAAYDLMAERHFRHVPIVDDDDNLVGLVTERDLLRHVLGQLADLPMTEQRRYLATQSIDELMTADPESVEPDTTAESAGLILIEQKFGCLPVCEGRQLVGILTETDFVKHVVKRD